MWILCINLQQYVKIGPKMLKNDGLERSWGHLGPTLAPKGVKMSFGRLPGRFWVLFWAVMAPFGKPLGLPGPHLGASWAPFWSPGRPKIGAQMAPDIAKTWKFLWFSILFEVQGLQNGSKMPVWRPCWTDLEHMMASWRL